MKQLKKFFLHFFIVLLTVIVTFFLLEIFIPSAPSQMKVPFYTQKNTIEKENILLVTLGESLTKKNPSSSENGFTPLLGRKLESEFNFEEVITQDFEEVGYQSQQILARLKKSEQMRESIAKADLIVLSVGQNDLMNIIRKDLEPDLSLSSFEKSKQEYIHNLDLLYKEMRILNPNAPIYQLGVYNPFYLYFPNTTQMKDIVNMWNSISESFVRGQKDSYFVPIQDLLYEEVNGKIGLGENEDKLISKKQPTVKNLLTESENVYPNTLGYQMIADALKMEMIQTQKIWLVR